MYSDNKRGHDRRGTIMMVQKMQLTMYTTCEITYTIACAPWTVVSSKPAEETRSDILRDGHEGYTSPDAVCEVVIKLMTNLLEKCNTQTPTIQYTASAIQRLPVCRIVPNQAKLYQ